MQDFGISLEAFKDGGVHQGGGRHPLKFLLDFVLKLNSAFVTAQELEEIFCAILVGATSGEGLGFNRAFLFLVDESGRNLRGRFGLGPRDVEEASRIWSSITSQGLNLFQILDQVQDQLADDNQALNRFVRSIEISMDKADNCFVRSLKENRAYLVTDYPRVGAVHSQGLCRLFGSGEIVVAPLNTHGKEYGVVVADNVFTRAPITQESLYCLHLFTGLGSLAICQRNMCRDLEEKVSSLRQAKEAVEAQKNLLVEVERYSAIGRMLDHLLHEIRNPLAAIGGIARLLEKKEPQEDRRRRLAAVVKEVEKIEKTLSAVTELHEIDAIHCRELELVSLVDMAVLMVQGDLEEAGIVLHKNYPKDPVVMQGDRERLQEALLCLLKNSIEAMPDGGIMVLALMRKGPDIELRISDSGLGIARGHFKKADNPFFTTKFNAMGLGLSKAKKIIELHSGSLHLTSNRIGGTTCVITLPDSRKIDVADGRSER